jgi:hypothetical protein
MEGDISNKTIVVLVVLTVLISVLSTLVILNEVTNLNQDSIRPKVQGQSQGGASGQVTMGIKERPSSSTGQVTFEIQEAG